MRFLLLTLALLAAPVTAEPSSDLRALLAEHWAWYLAENPLTATDIGDRSGDGRLPDLSVGAMDRRAAHARAFVMRLDAVPISGLTPAERTDRAILRRVLVEQVEANGFAQRLVPFTSYGSWHTAFAGLPEQSGFVTRADFESYLARLEAYSASNAQVIVVARAGLVAGVAQPCEALAGYERTITAHIVPDAEASVFWAPFRVRPDAVAATDWSALRARARAAIMGSVVQSYRTLAAFYRDEYRPRCRASVGVSATPGGAAYYTFRVRAETTTTLTATEIHALGLREVARIGAEMDAVSARAGYANRTAFVAWLRTDPAQRASTPDALLSAAATVAKRIDGELPRYFGLLPRLPYTVKPIPADQAEGTTTAYYEPGAAAAGRAGIYRVNTSKLAERPLFELPALTSHEAVPGHHLQIALQQELPLPPFRRYATGFTAFVEGWGLYSERLGVAMGLYDTPAKDMGRLSYEMWRACRLVVDTGIHSQGWSKQRAIDFMVANTALSRANIEAEVNRYISWPGQALAYKLGELRIRAARARAEAALGAAFDLRRFHDVVLGQGAVPLDVLDANVDAWIADQRKRATTSR